MSDDTIVTYVNEAELIAALKRVSELEEELEISDAERASLAAQLTDTEQQLYDACCHSLCLEDDLAEGEARYDDLMEEFEALSAEYELVRDAVVEAGVLDELDLEESEVH